MAQLSEKSIADGRVFLQALDGAGIVSSAALWLWRPSENAGITSMRMSGNVINGVRIDDAYVYRLNRRI
jgi:hypothetical protein